uniref:Uncharacterized protein n=1 Tax=Oryza brachyantha TaxID=4533 RepID=J3MRM3_ORYBR
MGNGWQVPPLTNLSSCGIVLQTNLFQLSEGMLQMSTRSVPWRKIIGICHEHHSSCLWPLLPFMLSFSSNIVLFLLHHLLLIFEHTVLVSFICCYFE